MTTMMINIPKNLICQDIRAKYYYLNPVINFLSCNKMAGIIEVFHPRE